SDLRVEVKITSNGLQPLYFQWRREHLYFVTNVSFITNTNLYDGGFYRTNREASFTVAELPGETSAVYVMQNVTTNVYDYYSVAISNALGVALSQRARPLVLSVVATRATNDYCFGLRCITIPRQCRVLAGIRDC